MTPRTPTSDELRHAFQCGFESIDAGDGFYHGFDGYLSLLGYEKQPDAGCTCSDGGAHGNLPECRWVKS